MAFDFSAVSAPFRMQPGLRRLAPGAHQLSPNEPNSAALRAKLAVLTRAAETALLTVPDFDPAPALAALVRQGCTEWLHALAQRGDGVEAPLLGWSVQDGEVTGTGASDIGNCLRALPPSWRLAGLLSLAFAEDFAIIDGRSGRIPWLAVCLPSHWSPADKVGRHFAEVHAPVADNRMLLAAADHLARLVTGEARWERFVWTITRDGGLDGHPERVVRPPWPHDAGADALAALAWLRTERQTFIPLPALGQAIFTIHVELLPLADAARPAAHARLLHDALASMSPAVLDYRGLTAARDRLLHWLERAAHGAAAG